MKDAILVTTLLVQALLGGSLILTILMPRYRVWHVYRDPKAPVGDA